MSEQTRQVAALPIKLKNDELRVLLITSRDTGRWVMPKGWRMDGKKDWHAAEIEALEEAGVVGTIGQRVIGTFNYAKNLGNGKARDVRVAVYPLYVDALKRRWKERDERTRRWFSAKGAAKAVDEPELEILLRDLSKGIKKRPEIRDILP